MEEQALCIVNTRKHAQALFSKVKSDAAFHLSTLMCPAHRREIFSVIRSRLDDGKKCKVVSTSLVEAGVDLDFITVYRAKAGLDSIIQAGGRCNREKKRGIDESSVIIFESDEYKAPRAIDLNISAFEHAVRFSQNNDLEIDSPESIAMYFEFIYKLKGDLLDKKNIMRMFSSPNIQFEEISLLFQIIEQNSRQVIVPYNKDAIKLINRLKYAGVSQNLFRELAKYTVSLPVYEFNSLLEANKLDIINEQAVLKSGDNNYSIETGICVELDLNNTSG